MPRMQAMQAWLATLFPAVPYTLAPASADASFRSYHRLTLADGQTRIVMDAPPEHEDCRPFLAVAECFAVAGVHVPAVLASNLEAGFLLLSDLGSTTYLAALTPSTAHALYGDATRALLSIQQASRPGVLPEYDRALLERELQLFPEWYIGRHLGVTLDAEQQQDLSACFERLLANNLAQPQVFVHRDYHSRNLMVCTPNPGILDFQDAVYGPITYDLVSLLRDAYIHWEEDEEMDWVIRYWEQARRLGLPVSPQFGEFYQDYEWMGVQRQLKVLGIFARLYHRDGKDAYLKEMPRVLAYLRGSVNRYNALKPLAQLLDVLEQRPAAVGYTF